MSYLGEKYKFLVDKVCVVLKENRIMVKKKKEKKKSYRVWWVRAEGQKLNESRGTKRGSNTAYQSGGAERVAVGI